MAFFGESEAGEIVEEVPNCLGTNRRSAYDESNAAYGKARRLPAKKVRKSNTTQQIIALQDAVEIDGIEDDLADEGLLMIGGNTKNQPRQQRKPVGTTATQPTAVERRVVPPTPQRQPQPQQAATVRRNSQPQVPAAASKSSFSGARFITAAIANAEAERPLVHRTPPRVSRAVSSPESDTAPPAGMPAAMVNVCGSFSAPECSKLPLLHRPPPQIPPVRRSLSAAQPPSLQASGAELQGFSRGFLLSSKEYNSKEDIHPAPFQRPVESAASGQSPRKISAIRPGDFNTLSKAIKGDEDEEEVRNSKDVDLIDEARGGDYGFYDSFSKFDATIGDTITKLQSRESLGSSAGYSLLRGTFSFRRHSLGVPRPNKTFDVSTHGRTSARHPRQSNPPARVAGGGGGGGGRTDDFIVAASAAAETPKSLRYQPPTRVMTVTGQRVSPSRQRGKNSPAATPPRRVSAPQADAHDLSKPSAYPNRMRKSVKELRRKNTEFTEF